MSYFGFLLQFLVIPIILLFALALWDGQQEHRRTSTSQNWPIWSAIVLHVAIALLYTTPWDNYLVATRVWWYDPALVTGLTLGWVPIEEYTFFILQPILGGLWLLFLARRTKVVQGHSYQPRRLWLTMPAGILWVAAAVLLISGWQPGTYLALELVWALPPIALQLAFGGDILWRYRRLLLLAVVPLTLYLSAADALAIGWGTWTINPAQSLNIFVAGVLPVEELLFFLLTNTLVVFGLVLIWAKESHGRLAALRRRLSSGITPQSYLNRDALLESVGHSEEVQV